MSSPVEHAGAPESGPLTRTRAFRLGLLLGTPVSIVFLWLAVRHADLDAVWSALREARPAPLAGAVAAMGGVYLLQADRWRRITDTQQVGRRRFTVMVVEGVAVNNVLPGRLGDLLRARWLGTAARIPGGRALGTVVLDRGADLASLVGILLLSSLVVGDAPWLRRVALVGLAALAVLVALVGFAHLYTSRRARARRRRRGTARRLLRDTLEGLATPMTRTRAAAVGLLSVAAWSTWAGAAWLVARSVGIELDAAEALFAAAAINLGVAIPSSPGFIGTYQWLGVQTLGLFGVTTNRALAFAILLQAVWYVPTTVVGGGLILARATRVASVPRTAQGADATGDTPQP